MGESITYISGDSHGSGYLALPASGSGPAVIVIQEWWGLVPHIKDIADRFAAAGFVALAPDLYRGEIAAEPDTAKKLLMELELTRAGTDISAAATYLLDLPAVTSSSVGTVGFCMGGSLSIWSATLSDFISAAVAYYPGASWERHAPVWTRFAGKAALIHCAEGDGTSAAPGIQEAVSEITAAGGTIATSDYPGTAHAFFNDDRPEVYAAPAAELSWQRTLEFFKTRLK